MNPVNILIMGNNRLASSLSECWQLNNYHVVHHPENMEKVNFVIETENLDKETKQMQLGDIEKSISKDTPILTTTLGWSATEVASWLMYPERVIGFAAFDNVKDAPGIEAVLPLQGKESYLLYVTEQFKQIRKEVIEVDEDEPGLVYPRILSMIVNEAAYALMEQTASARDIDRAMKLGTNYPAGPLEWAAEIGIDNVYAVLQGLYQHLGEERYRPASLIKKLVYANWIGHATKKDFYYFEKRKNKEFTKM